MLSPNTLASRMIFSTRLAVMTRSLHHSPIRLDCEVSEGVSDHFASDAENPSPDFQGGGFDQPVSPDHKILNASCGLPSTIEEIQIEDVCDVQSLSFLLFGPYGTGQNQKTPDKYGNPFHLSKHIVSTSLFFS
jgi:hypothetical protein